LKQTQIEQSIVTAGRCGDLQSEGVCRLVHDDRQPCGNGSWVVVEPEPQFRVAILTQGIQNWFEISGAGDVSRPGSVGAVNHVGVETGARHQSEAPLPQL